MTMHSRTLGCVGLSPREATQARLLLGVSQDRLDGQWQLVDSAESNDSDVVLADPSSRAGRRVIDDERMASRIIAVLDRDTPAPASVGARLYRPFRSVALIDAINSVERSDTAPSAGTTEQMSLDRAIRRALGAVSGPEAVLIEGLDGRSLLIDGTRDRMRGALDALSAERLQASPSLPVRRLAASEADAVLADAKDTSAYAELWRRGREVAGNPGLFGQDGNSRVRFVRWPRQSHAKLSRAEMRAVSLARRHAWTVAGLARRSGLDVDALSALCNAAWLSGDLESGDATTESASQARTGETRRGSGHGRPSSSLIARIRSRLGAG